MPASGLVAPFLMLVAVRAMAPVAAKPPNSGVEQVGDALADQLLVRVMLRACHAVGHHRGASSDSMAPSSAMVNAGPTSWITWLQA
jgi:hypothetical protein